MEEDVVVVSREKKTKRKTRKAVERKYKIFLKRKKCVLREENVIRF